MPSHEERQTQYIQKISVEVAKIAKIFEAMNTNLAEIGKMMRADIESRVEVMASALEEYEKNVVTAPFSRGNTSFDLHQLVGSTVRVCDEHDERFSQRGKVTGINHLGILVKFENEVVPTNFFREDQLELIPKSKDGGVVPVRDGIGGPVIGTAKISEDETGLVADMEIPTSRIGRFRYSFRSPYENKEQFAPRDALESPATPEHLRQLGFNPGVLEEAEIPGYSIRVFREHVDNCDGGYHKESENAKPGPDHSKMSRPCDEGDSNVCVAEGCYDESCTKNSESPDG